MDDNRKSCIISRDKTDNITFQAEGFLVPGPYENFIKKTWWQPSDFLESSKAKHTLPSRKKKGTIINGWQSCKPIFYKDAYGHSVDFKWQWKKLKVAEP